MIDQRIEPASLHAQGTADDDPIRQFQSEMELWIDEHTADPSDVSAVLSWLMDHTIGSESHKQGVTHPSINTYEDYLWSWNRAGGNYLNRGFSEQAIEVWSGAYLGLLMIQHRYQLRIHKGEPLCNLGVAASRNRNASLATMSWLLGVIEDTLSDPETCEDEFNFTNLLSHGFSRTYLHRFSERIEDRFNAARMVAACPELAFVTGVDEGAGFSPTLLEKMTRLLGSFSASWPQFPVDHSVSGLIRDIWGELHIPESATAREK